MSFEVSKGAAAAVLFSVLSFFTLLAIASAGWFGNTGGVGISSFWTLNKATTTDGADYFLAARKSAGTTAIALSFFASGMGAWVVYGTYTHIYRTQSAAINARRARHTTVS